MRLVKDKVKLVEIPQNVDTFGWQLTVGKIYKIVDFEGGNVRTTTDKQGEIASYNPTRIKRVK